MKKSKNRWHPKAKPPTKISRFGKMLLTVMTVVGFLQLIYPRMTITISGPSDDRQPLSSSFLISNDGVLPVFSVAATCLVKQLTIGGTTIQGEGGQFVSVLGAAMPPTRTLYPGQKESIPFSNCFITEPSNLLKVADIGLQANYRNWIYFPMHPITSEFHAKSIGLNHFVWYSNPGE
jgi:hypothetical protein